MDQQQAPDGSVRVVSHEVRQRAQSGCCDGSSIACAGCSFAASLMLSALMGHSIWQNAKLRHC